MSPLHARFDDPASVSRPSVLVQVKAVDPAVVKQLESAPVLNNLARTLAFHKRQLEDTPLPAAQAAQQREFVSDLTEMLRTIMCL